MRTRPPRPIDQADQNRIIAALERLPDKEGFVGHRTRAYVYLLLDGALRSGAALWLNIEEVVKDPTASRIQVVQEPVMRPCEGNKYRERRLVMSDRARDAIADYLKEVRNGGWLAKGSRLEGPLWISTQPVGAQQRMSRRTAMVAWKSFLEGVPGVSEEYQLDDVVLTGRVAFVNAANASPELLSEHAGIGTKAAMAYSDHLTSRPGSASDVLARLDSKENRRPPRVVPPAPERPATAVAPSAPPPDITDQIRKLAELRDAKVLTEREFQTKKRELLARI